MVTIGGMAVDQDANVQLSSCPMGLTRRRRHHQVETSEIQGTRNERQQRRETNKVKKKGLAHARTHTHSCFELSAAAATTTTTTSKSRN